MTEVARAPGGFAVRTDAATSPRRVVHATNAWARRLVPALDGVIVPVRGQVIVTAPAPRLWTFGLSTNFGYEYWMQRPDGRVVLGGMRWLTPTQEVGTDDDTVVEPEVGAALRAFLPKHFPELAGVPSSASGRASWASPPTARRSSAPSRLPGGVRGRRIQRPRHADGVPRRQGDRRDDRRARSPRSSCPRRFYPTASSPADPRRAPRVGAPPARPRTQRRRSGKRR